MTDHIDTSAQTVLVRLKRPEGYEDVHPELILQDAGINPAFEPELVPAAADTSALRKLAEAASGGGHHVYTFPRDSNNWQANEDFIAACTRETILSLLDEVDALRSRANAVSGWQPIETAPKEQGAEVIGWFRKVRLDEDDNLTDEVIGGAMAQVSRHGDGWNEPDWLDAHGAYYFDDWSFEPEPALWHPLPAAPAALHQPVSEDADDIMPRLTDDQIRSIVDGMPGAQDGFCKGWGWLQFARAIEDALTPRRAAFGQERAASRYALLRNWAEGPADYMKTGRPWVVHIEYEHGVPTMAPIGGSALDAALDAALHQYQPGEVPGTKE